MRHSSRKRRESSPPQALVESHLHVPVESHLQVSAAFASQAVDSPEQVVPHSPWPAWHLPSHVAHFALVQTGHAPLKAGQTAVAVADDSSMADVGQMPGSAKASPSECPQSGPQQ